MTTAVTFRIPNNLLNEVSKLFKTETKTEAFIKAIEKGVEYQKSFKDKMIADYKSISQEERNLIEESFPAQMETFADEDFSEYLKYL